MSNLFSQQLAFFYNRNKKNIVKNKIFSLIKEILIMENKRAANFTESEINYLVNLVNKKKKSSARRPTRQLGQKKTRCWIEIQDDFNA